MIVYTAHEPDMPSRDVQERAENIVLIKEGFTWGGFFLNAFWLLLNGLWLEFVAALALGALSIAGLMALGFGEEAASAVNIFIGLAIGFEGNNLRRWRLARKGYSFITAVAGRDYEECERRFFDVWLSESRDEKSGSGWGGGNARRTILGDTLARGSSIVGTLPGAV